MIAQREHVQHWLRYYRERWELEDCEGCKRRRTMITSHLAAWREWLRLFKRRCDGC